MPSEEKKKELERREREAKNKTALEAQQKKAVFDLQNDEQARVDALEEERLTKEDEKEARKNAPVYSPAFKPLPTPPIAPPPGLRQI